MGQDVEASVTRGEEASLFATDVIKMNVIKELTTGLCIESSKSISKDFLLPCYWRI
ncbi:hypothetical protein R6Q59_024617 [Mikania micrantha]